mgnify:FL=1
MPINSKSYEPTIYGSLRYLRDVLKEDYPRVIKSLDADKATHIKKPRLKELKKLVDNKSINIGLYGMGVFLADISFRERPFGGGSENAYLNGLAVGPNGLEGKLRELANMRFDSLIRHLAVAESNVGRLRRPEPSQKANLGNVIYKILTEDYKIRPEDYNEEAGIFLHRARLAFSDIASRSIIICNEEDNWKRRYSPSQYWGLTKKLMNSIRDLNDNRKRVEEEEKKKQKEA